MMSSPFSEGVFNSNEISSGVWQLACGILRKLKMENSSRVNNTPKVTFLPNFPTPFCLVVEIRLKFYVIIF